MSRFPHAVLISGPEGIGKTEFAEHLATTLLCETPAANNLPCGSCQSCRWRATAQHPDFRRIAPGDDDEAEGSSAEVAPSAKAKKRGAPQIKIDQVRDLDEFVFRGSHRHGRRVVLIAEAEAMNSAAANALLKILEEPPEGVFFLLVTAQLRSLLPTLRSRCRSVTLSRPPREAAEAELQSLKLGQVGTAFLDLAGGAPRQVALWQQEGLIEPLTALIAILTKPPTDPLALAQQWDGLLRSDGAFRLEHLVIEVQRWLFDLIEEAASGRVRFHGAWPRPTPRATMSPVTSLIAGWQELLRFRRSARHPLNQLLFLEDLATHFLRAVHAPQRGAS